MSVTRIQVDLANSTQYFESGLGPYIALQNALFEEMESIVLSLHPLLILHEVLGDSFVLTLNTPWWSSYEMTRLDTVIVNMSHLISNRLDAVCNNYSNGVFVRVGFAIGPLVARMSGSRFRLYGRAMNLAARLENICERGQIVGSYCGGGKCETVETSKDLAEKKLSAYPPRKR